MIRSLNSGATVVDLFAGAGLFSCAFALEGFQVAHAVELDHVAASTYALNVGRHIQVADIRRIRPSGRCDVLVAGPPCQGFSTLGKRDARDPRNFLSLYVAEWAAVLKPRIVVVENVASFLDSPVWARLVRKLQKLNYATSAVVLSALDHGVPQRRTRSFTFFSKVAMPELKRSRSRNDLTVRRAWEGLSSSPDGKNHHYAPVPTQLALARMRVIRPGGDKRDVMKRAPRLAPRSWWDLGCAVTDSWGRMEWDEPSNTIRTDLHPSKGRYIHPEQHRTVSLREAARLQTIPDGWRFHGSPTQIERQIGNSVPLGLGRTVARAIAASL